MWGAARPPASPLTVCVLSAEIAATCSGLRRTAVDAKFSAARAAEEPARRRGGQVGGQQAGQGRVQQRQAARRTLGNDCDAARHAPREDDLRGGRPYLPRDSLHDVVHEERVRLFGHAYGYVCTRHPAQGREVRVAV